MFQSAGRIIGWLKSAEARSASARAIVSIRRADYWLVEDEYRDGLDWESWVSIRRADYWLVEGSLYGVAASVKIVFQSAGRIIGWLKDVALPNDVLWSDFNPPGGLLVG